MTSLETFLEAFVRILGKLWDLGLQLSEQLINSTPYLDTEPVVVLGVAIICFAVWLRH